MWKLPFFFSMEASITSMKASMKTSMEAIQRRFHGSDGSFHGSGGSFSGSFHELPRNKQVVQETAEMGPTNMEQYPWYGQIYSYDLPYWSTVRPILTFLAVLPGTLADTYCGKLVTTWTCTIHRQEGTSQVSPRTVFY